jgi:hypothetical protein
MHMARQDVSIVTRHRMVRENERPNNMWSIDALEAQLDRRITSPLVVVAAHQRHIDLTS